jgi:hypothetical protein
MQRAFFKQEEVEGTLADGGNPPLDHRESMQLDTASGQGADVHTPVHHL